MKTQHHGCTGQLQHRLALKDEHPLFQPIIIGLVLNMTDAEIVAFNNRKHIDQRTTFGLGRMVFQFADGYFDVLFDETIPQHFKTPRFAARCLTGFAL